MEVEFGGTPLNQISQPMSLAKAHQHLTISYQGKSYALYTLVIYDINAPTPNNSYNSPFLHYLVVNIPGTWNGGDALTSYMAPEPPEGSPPHEYVIDIYYQPTSIGYKTFLHGKFDLGSFIKEHKLVLMARTSFLVKSS